MLYPISMIRVYVDYWEEVEVPHAQCTRLHSSRQDAPSPCRLDQHARGDSKGYREQNQAGDLPPVTLLCCSAQIYVAKLGRYLLIGYNDKI
jgi:hypothetical protein